MRKKLAVTGFVMVLLGLAGTQALSMMTKPDRVKAWIESAVLSATGRHLHIDGRVKITLSLIPSIQANDVRFENITQGTRNDMAIVERIEARIYLPALLRHHILITNLRLTGPNLLFEQVKGHPNWLFFPPPEKGKAPAPAADADTASSYGFDVRSVWIKDGLIAWNLPERQGNLGIKAFDWARSPLTNAVSMRSILIHADHPLTASMHAIPEGNDLAPWKVAVQIAAAGAHLDVGGVAQLTGEYHLRLKGGAPKLEALSPYADRDLPPLRDIGVTATVNHPAGFDAKPDLRDVAMKFAGGDLAAWAPGLRLGPTSVVLPQINKPATIETQIFWQNQLLPVGGTIAPPMIRHGVPWTAIDLHGFSPAIPLHDISIDGDVGYDQAHQSAQFDPLRIRSQEVEAIFKGSIGFGSPLSVEGAIQMPRLNADALLPPKADGADKWAWLTAPLPWRQLALTNLSVTGHVGTLTFLQDTWRDIDLSVALDRGVLHRASVAMRLSGSPVDAVLTADSRRQTAGLAIKATSLPLSLLLREAGLPAEAQGGFHVGVDLHAAGNNPVAMSKTLNGPIALRMDHGHMSNAALQAIAGPALKALGSDVPQRGDTAIACLGVDGAFTGGEGKLSDIAIDTTYLRMAGRGVLNFGNQTAALKLHPVAMLAGSMVSVPVVVKGSFHHMQAGLDANGFDQAGLMLDALFGGDTPNICGRVPPALPAGDWRDADRPAPLLPVQGGR